MTSTKRKLFRGIFGTLVVGALGLGASQALASPAATAAGATCSKEEAWECIYGCKEQYGSNYAGRCTKNVWGHVTCQCYQLAAPSGN